MDSAPPFVPVGRDHALSEVVLGVTFNEPLAPVAMEAFRTHSILADELPSHVVHQGHAITLRALPGGNIEQHLAPIGMGIEKVDLQRFNNGGQIEWLVGIEKQRVHASCFAYTRWRDVADRSYSYLDAIFRTLQSHRPYANAVGLQCVDEFFSTRPLDEGATELLRGDVDWIAPVALKSVGYFHSNVGWFEDPGGLGGRRLVRINVEALPVDNFKMVPAGATYGIRISTFLRTDATHQPFPLVISHGGEIRDLFEAMHIRSKELVRDLLTIEMCRRIGLSE